VCRGSVRCFTGCIRGWQGPSQGNPHLAGLWGEQSNSSTRCVAPPPPDPPGCCVAESSGLPPGPVLGGHPDGRLLLHGAALVRGGHRHLHRPHRQLEDGDGDQRPGGAAPVPGRQVRKARPRSSSGSRGIIPAQQQVQPARPHPASLAVPGSRE